MTKEMLLQLALTLVHSSVNARENVTLKMVADAENKKFAKSENNRYNPYCTITPEDIQKVIEFLSNESSVNLTVENFNNAMLAVRIYRFFKGVRIRSKRHATVAYALLKASQYYPDLIPSKSIENPPAVYYSASDIARKFNIAPQKASYILNKMVERRSLSCIKSITQNGQEFPLKTMFYCY